MNYWIDAITKEWGMVEAAAYSPEPSFAGSDPWQGPSRTETLLKHLDTVGFIILEREDFVEVFGALQDLSFEVSFSSIEPGCGDMNREIDRLTLADEARWSPVWADSLEDLEEVA